MAKKSKKKKDSSKKESASKSKKSNKEDKSLDNVIDAIREKFGEGAIMRLGEAARVDVDTISTGSYTLDTALGVGGLPRGRIVEIYGPEGSGKTTLALHVVREAQKKGGKVAFIDAEHALDPEWARMIGVKVNELLISQPDTGEESLNILETLVRSGGIDLIVVDSVAALTPRAEIEGEMGAHHVGLQARLMSQALRKLTAISAKSKTMVIFINQVRMKIGVMFGNPETTPGGKALKFYSSVRLDVRKRAQIKKGDDIVGNRMKIKVVKNKVAPPFRVAECDLLFDEGISYESDIITLGQKYKVVKRSGSYYKYEGETLGQGMDNARIFLKENSKVAKAIVKDIEEAMKEKAKEKKEE